MTADGDDASFPARLDSADAAAAFVSAFCGRHAIETGDALRIALVVEELFLNIVTHGYGDAPGGTIHFAFSRDELGVTIVCEDYARAYDPRLAFEQPPAASASGSSAISPRS
jgi:anti-sigma regulatory factor (Ser/Thr protein kinase)